MMKKIASLCCMLISIILMALPFGVSMTFAPSPTERVTEYFSYFSMMPLGYGDWFPIITALLSIFVFMLLLVDIKKVNTRRAVQTCLCTCIIVSLLSWIVFNSVSAVGVCITVLHIIVLVLQAPQKPEPAK